MSKKLAEGIDALVLDVKTGSGAFMKKEEDAVNLAELMVETGQRMGKRVVALITDMNQPLGRKVGNALEIEECIEVMRGGGPQDLRELCLELAAWMLYLAGRTTTLPFGRGLAAEILDAGNALEKFREIIWLQGGERAVIDDFERLPRARNRIPVVSPASGFVGSIQCEQVGTAVVVLGGGREKKEDAVDPAVGLVLHKKLGDPVHAGEPLLTLHYNSEARLAEARGLLESAFTIAPEPPAPPNLVHRVIGE
jgi:thymidine phosphorylase